MRFKNFRFAQEYEKRLSAEGYPGKLFDLVKQHLPPGSSVLDVGAGSGFFSIPLAYHGYKVTAIEPSGEMTAFIRKKVAESQLENITICEETWDHWNGTKHDCLICIHALYPMGEIMPACQKMLETARLRLCLVKMDGSPKTLSDIIRKEFKKTRVAPSFNEKLKKILLELDTPFTSEKVVQVRTQHFKTILDEAEYYSFHIGLDTKFIPQIAEIIEDHAQKDEHGFYYASEYHDELIIF